MNILEAKDVSLRFGGSIVLQDVSFQVTNGELFSIIGPNGAGKSSLFNCISGLYRPNEGFIRFQEHSLQSFSPHALARLGISRMFQNIALFGNMTLLENLLVGRHIHQRGSLFGDLIFSKRARAREIENIAAIEEIIDLLELSPYRNYPVDLLPYGVRKRVELGRALAMKPKMLLLDEPAAGLNLQEKQDLARYLLEIRKNSTVTLLLIEHDLRFVMELSDRVLALNFGKVLTCGVPKDIANHPEVQEAYLGGAAL